MVFIKTSTGIFKNVKGQEVNDVVDTLGRYWRLV